jgi:hypothetical protein
MRRVFDQPVIPLTVKLRPILYRENAAGGFHMSTSEPSMNRFERILFSVAVALGALLITVRLGSVAFIWYAHHVR